MIRCVAERGRSSQPGIESWHCLSSGPFYDPELVSFGPVIGLDEHRVAPGAGFDWHAHRGVHILSWVLEGALRHEDSSGELRFVSPGSLLVQSSGERIQHSETNASDSEALRFLQVTVLADAAPLVRTERIPSVVAGVQVSMSETFSGHGPSMVLIVDGEFAHDGVDPLPCGSWLMVEEDLAIVEGEGRLFVVTVEG